MRNESKCDKYDNFCNYSACSVLTVLSRFFLPNQVKFLILFSCTLYLSHVKTV